MSRLTIPERRPICDRFPGAVVLVDGEDVLMARAPEGASVRISGDLIVRYGLRRLGKPHLVLVPGLVVVDYGTMLTGEAAWEFVLRNSNLYPRAEVFGWRNDGQEDMMTVKQLDLTLLPMTLVYASEADWVPAAAPTRLRVPDGMPVPARLREYLKSEPDES